MKLAERNMQTFYYRLYSDKASIIDDDGNDTGQYRVTYSSAVSAKGNISPSSGDAQTDMFGTNVDYDKVLVMNGINSPIDENTILFVGIEPSEDSEGNPLPNYHVSKVAKGLNYTSYALQKVEVS